MKALAVLLNWRRSGNLCRIIESLSRVPEVIGVAVWNNAPAMSYDDIMLRDTIRKAPAHWPKITLCGSGGNVCTYGRYLAAMEMGQGDVVLTQDDDYVVHNWPQIIASWEDRRDRVSCCLHPWHMERDATKRWRGDDGTVLAHEVLVGWGAAFDWRIIEPAMKPYAVRYGNTQELYREADRIFTIGMQKEHRVMPHHTTALDGETSRYSAMYLQPGHMESIVSARTNALKLLGIEYKHKGL